MPTTAARPLSTTNRTMNVHVHVPRLRSKLGEHSMAPRYLHTVRGIGLRLSAPDDSHVTPPPTGHHEALAS
jgi:DNA-binding response OmpR family regulator